MTSEKKKFAHRENLDGTFDSICTYCFQTIASAKEESKLQLAEQKHVCEPHLIRRFGTK